MNVKMHDSVSDCVSKSARNIRHISAAQLANLGMDEVAFVKPVMTADGPAFAIHAADGELMAIVSDVPLAAAVIVQEEMRPALVH